MTIKLRDYQNESINAVLSEPYGSKSIIALAVGLGKSFTAAQIHYALEKELQRPVRTLWIARQRQLVYQPTKYFPDKTTGMEMGKHFSENEDVVFATAQSLHRRLDKFDPSEFDLLIADECFTGDVEILTENGFIRFDELEDEKVAQVDEELKLNYVEPIRKIKKHYDGELVMSRVDTASRTGGKWIGMTPNHRQVFYNNVTKELESMYIKDFKPTRDRRYRVINHLNSNNDDDRVMTALERLYIAAQADGSVISENDVGYRYRFTFSKERKIERLLKLCEEAGIDVVEGYSRTFDNPKWKDSRSFLLTLEKDCTYFTNFLDYDIKYSFANEFINEVSLWDGYNKDERTINYDSVVKENSDYVNFAGFIAGWNSVLDSIPRKHKNKKHQDNFRATITKRKTKIPYKPATKFNIDNKKHNDFVYCVTVPTSMIVVRKDGHIFVSHNCQEIAGKQYADILAYFKTKHSVGLSGTPFRMDGQKLTDGFFDKIVYQKDIKWGIDNGYLCDVDAVRCYIDYDLGNVRTSGGDYNLTDLGEAMKETHHAISEAYYKYSDGKPTLIFASGVDHAFAIASLIDGAEVIVGDTPQEERDRIFNGFENKEIPCIVSVEVMTQGVDLPIATVGIFAKPTKSIGRYQQQVGRILRKHPEKEKALIVDCIGSSSLGLCTAPTLVGVNIDLVPEDKQQEVEGDLMDLIDLVEELSDTPTSWIRNTKQVQLWSRENKVKTNQIDFTLMPDGKISVILPERVRITIPPVDMLGNVDATKIKGMSKDLHEWGLGYYGDTWSLQKAINAVEANLKRNYSHQDKLWDRNKVRSWGKKPATPQQINFIKRLEKEFVPEEPLTRVEAQKVIQMSLIKKEGRTK